MMVPEIIIVPVNWARAGNISGQHALETDYQRTRQDLADVGEVQCSLRQTTQPFVAQAAAHGDSQKILVPKKINIHLGSNSVAHFRKCHIGGIIDLGDRILQRWMLQFLQSSHEQSNRLPIYSGG